MNLFKRPAPTIPLQILTANGYSVISLSTKVAAITVYSKAPDLEAILPLVRSFIAQFLRSDESDEPYQTTKASDTQGYA